MDRQRRTRRVNAIIATNKIIANASGVSGPPGMVDPSKLTDEEGLGREKSMGPAGQYGRGLDPDQIAADDEKTEQLIGRLQEGLNPAPSDDLPLTEQQMIEAWSKRPEPVEFSQPRIAMEDPTMAFKPKDFTTVKFMKLFAPWIASVDDLRRAGIDKLYFLNPADMTIYDKYFGININGKWIDTPATYMLRLAATSGRSRGGRNPNLVKKIENVRKVAGAGKSFFTLPPDQEKAIIDASAQIISDANMRARNINSISYDPKTDSVTVTNSFAHNKTPGGKITYNPEQDISQDIKRAIQAMNIALGKDIADGEKYPKLVVLIDEFVGKLGESIPEIVKEQNAANKVLNIYLSSNKLQGLSDEERKRIRKEITEYNVRRIINDGIIRLVNEKINPNALFESIAQTEDKTVI